MRGNLPMKIVYIPQSIPVRTKLYRPPRHIAPRKNQVSPRPVFTCIDEIYSTGPVSYPVLQQTRAPLNSFSQEPKDNRSTQTRYCRKSLFTAIIIIIVVCVIAIIILLAVFLTRSN